MLILILSHVNWIEKGTYWQHKREGSECNFAPSGTTFIQWLAQLPDAEGSLFIQIYVSREVKYCPNDGRAGHYWTTFLMSDEYYKCM